MARELNKKLVLEDGTQFLGYSFGANTEKVCEIVFNTSMVGYQEIVTDLSYTYQMVVMTYPIIGNYGITDEDNESKAPTIGGLIVNEYNDSPSNFRYTRTLSEYLEEYDIPGISGIDTRYLTRIIRNNGTMRAIITDMGTSVKDALQIIKYTMVEKDAVELVSCKKRWYSRTPKHEFNIVAVDCGIKLNMIRSLNERGCNVTIVPHNTTANELLSLNPDGVFISNGPGDPSDAPCVIDLIKQIKGKVPIFGICLGHQLIALAYGAKTYKLKFGHRGGNHPVKNLKSGKVEMTSQNHSFAVDADSVKDTSLEVTHINLLDNTVEGLKNKEDKIFSVQYHPESAPGPKDSKYLFDEFIKMIKEGK